MKANELRTGNWVTAIQCDRSKVNQQIEQINSLGDFAVTTHGWSELKAIPITKKWLVKFGFVKLFSKFDNGYEINEMILNNTYDKGCEGWCFYDGNVACCNNMNYKNPVKYVHQLQNLYFALTGEELTIKEN